VAPSGTTPTPSINRQVEAKVLMVVELPKVVELPGVVV